MKNKLAIFDMDGTLFDTSLINYEAYKGALNEFSYDLEYEYFRDYCNGKYYLEFLPLLTNNADIELINKIHSRKKELYAKFISYGKVNNHLFSLINIMKSEYFISLVTTASFKNTNELLVHFQKKELFDLILTSEDVIKRKPNPEGFLKAINYFHVDAKSTIIFEDSNEGITAAELTGGSVLKIISF